MKLKSNNINEWNNQYINSEIKVNYLYIVELGVLYYVLLVTYWHFSSFINPLRPEFNIVIFIHYKPRIAAAILDL